MKDAKKTVRIQLVMSPEEVERLDAWRGPKRIWSRSEAIRHLVSEGIERDGTPKTEEPPETPK